MRACPWLRIYIEASENGATAPVVIEKALKTKRKQISPKKALTDHTHVWDIPYILKVRPAL